MMSKYLHGIAIFLLLLSMLLTPGIGRTEHSSPGEFALLSEQFFKEMGWEVETDSRPADHIAANVADVLGLPRDRPGKGIYMLAWKPASAQIAGVIQILYAFSSSLTAEAACNALFQNLPNRLGTPLLRTRPVPIVNGHGQLLVTQDPIGQAVWLIGCRASSVTVLGILSADPEVSRELLQRLQPIIQADNSL